MEQQQQQVVLVTVHIELQEVGGSQNQPINPI
jgi:hypothetical protein